MRRIAMYLVISSFGLGAAVGCGDQTATEAAGERAKEAASTLEKNVERSAEVYEDTYEKSRAEGENVVDASGDAYDAVLDEADEERKKKEQN